MLRLLLLVSWGLTLAAQTQIDLRTQAKNIDFSAANSTRPIKTGTVLPATCVAGNMFFKTDAQAGENLYGCTAANTWSIQGGIPSGNCQYNATSQILTCTDSNNNLYTVVETATSGALNQWIDYIASTGIPHTSQPTAAAVGAVADPGSNGIPYRNGPGTAAPANAGQMSGPFFCQDAGAGGGYACSLNPPIPAYQTGATYWFKAGAANTGAATINFNALGPKSILKQYNKALAANDILAGQWVIVTYDGTNMEMQSQIANTPQGAVPSVFGRTGAVTAQGGDYSFPQISGTASASQLPGVAMRTDQGNAVTAGTQDFSNAAHTLPMKSGTTAMLPPLCTPGETYFATDATAGGNVYGCTAPNVWLAQGNLSVKSSAVAVGARNTANFIAGAGMLSTVSDDGVEINIQSALDTAVVQTQPGEQSGSALLCASSSGSATQYACSMNPTLAAYTSGMALHWKPDVAGAGGPTTLNVDTLGTRPLKESDGATDPASTDISAGKLYNLWYDGSVFRFLAAVGGTGAALNASSPITYNGATGAIGCAACVTTATTADTDLAGTFPHLSVVKVNGAAIPTSGLLKANSAGQITQAAAGDIPDLSATYSTKAGTNTMIGFSDFSGGRWRLPEATFANAPGSPQTGQAWLFTDASTAGTCAGGGSAMAQCRWTGSAWGAIGGGPSITYPGAGVPSSTGSAWGSSYTVGTAANDLLQLNANGQVSAGQMPALTGDATSAAGSAATTVAKVNGGSVPANSALLGTNASSQLIAQTMWGSGTKPVAALALGISGNCVEWGSAGIADTGAPCGSGSGSGANALGYYFVAQAANAPANAINLGALTTGLLKVTVSGNVATPSTATAGTDYAAPNANTAGTAANLSGAPALPNGTTATTQTAGDATTKLATDAFVTAATPSASSSTPVMNGAGSAGSSANYARADHVHPTDTSRSPVAIYPSTAPSPGQLPVGNAGGTGYAPVTLSGSCTITSTGVITCVGGGGTTQRSFINQGVVQAGVSGMAVNLPSSNAPNPTSAGGTDPMSVLDFPQGATDYAWWSFLLPSGYTTGANVSILVESRCNPSACDSTNATTVTPYYTILTGALDAPTWTAGSPFTITNNAAGAVKQTTATITPVGATSGQRLGIKLVANTGSLTPGDSFQLVSFDPTLQVSSGAVASTGGANHVQTADGAGGFVDSGCTATGGAETCASGFAGNATTASNLSGTPAIPNGTTATTQTTGDSTTKIATDAFVAAAMGGVADATTTVGTAAISANTCTSATTVTMTGVTTAMTFTFTPTADLSAVTGWGAGGATLFVDAWPSANTLNYKVCNNSSASITPGLGTTWNVSAR
jgi:hypothetical protein